MRLLINCCFFLFRTTTVVREAATTTAAANRHHRRRRMVFVGMKNVYGSIVWCVQLTIVAKQVTGHSYNNSITTTTNNKGIRKGSAVSIYNK